jgi:hypothetical protein
MRYKMGTIGSSPSRVVTYIDERPVKVALMARAAIDLTVLT